MRRGAQGKIKATLGCFAYAILPLLAYVLVFLVLVGVEEWTSLALISEGFARSLLPVIGVGTLAVLCLTLIFAIAAGFMGVGAASDGGGRTRPR